MSTNSKLQDAPIFEGITKAAVESLCARGRVISFESGHRLFERGEDASELMILQDGLVELLFPVQIMGATRELTVETKRPGDVVAWSALVSPFSYTLGARCASSCSLACLERKTFSEFFAGDPETGYLFMQNLAGVIAHRLQGIQHMWLHELQASAIKRLG